MANSAQQSLATIDQFIASLEKTAEQPLSEPGSKGGETEHPVKNVDDRLQKAKEGERSRENTQDVKEDQGKPSIENAPEAKAASVLDTAARFARGPVKRAEGGAVSQGGSAADDAQDTVMNPQPTGEDPSCETSSAKGGKDDKRQGNRGGTSHPASTENSALEGGKYAADTPLAQLAVMMKESADTLIAKIAEITRTVPATSAQAAPAAAVATHKQAAEIDPALARQVGWEMAGLLNGTFDKQAADQLVMDTMEQIVKEASEDADNFIAFANSFFKQAEGPPPMPPGAAAGGGAPPPGGGGDEDAMLAALGGGAEAGGPPGAPPGGPPGGPDGGAGGGDGQALSPEQLAQLMEQLGVTPEELQQVLEMEMGGGAGGPPAGGPPPGGPPPGPGGAPGGGPPGMEAQAADQSGKPTSKQAMVQYLCELLQRSRPRR